MIRAVDEVVFGQFCSQDNEGCYVISEVMSFVFESIVF